MLEAIRIVSTWLDGSRTDWNAADQGVNVHIPLVSRWGADPVPPDISDVLEETTDAAAALKELPASTLSDDTDAKLLVWQPENEEFEGWVTQALQFADAVPLIIGYVRRNKDTARMIQDSHYTMRAVRRSLNVLFDPANHAARLANDLRLVTRTTDVLIKPWIQFGDLWVTYGLLTTIQVEDEAP